MVDDGCAGHTLVVRHQWAEVKRTPGFRSIIFGDVG